jgi:glycerol-3-phosphate acyltransferase PlsY
LLASIIGFKAAKVCYDSRISTFPNAKSIFVFSNSIYPDRLYKPLCFPGFHFSCHFAAFDDHIVVSAAQLSDHKYILMVLVVYRHRENIERLRNGNERKIGL